MNQRLFPHPMEALHKIFALIGPMVSEEKKFENVDDEVRRMSEACLYC